MKNTQTPISHPSKSTGFPMSQALAAFAAFSISALLVFGAVISGGNLKSSPYSARDAAADAKLSDLTDGAGAGILDGLINKLKTSALSKAGTPPKVSLYNAYIDGKLAKIDQLDNEVRNQYGNDYAFIFQYLYPRVLESRLKENATDSIIGQIGTIFSDDSENPPPELVATIPTCPAGYEFSTDHLACVKPTKVALDCKDESRVASWYKGDMARCPDPDGLKFWKDRVAVAGEIPTHSEFAAAVPKGEWYITGTQCSNQKRSWSTINCVDSGTVLQEKLNANLCEGTDTYIFNTNYCQKKAEDLPSASVISTEKPAVPKWKSVECARLVGDKTLRYPGETDRFGYPYWQYGKTWSIEMHWDRVPGATHYAVRAMKKDGTWTEQSIVVAKPMVRFNDIMVDEKGTYDVWVHALAGEVKPDGYAAHFETTDSTVWGDSTGKKTVSCDDPQPETTLSLTSVCRWDTLGRTLIQPLGDTIPEMTTANCNKANEYAEALEVGTNRIIAQCSCDNSVMRNGADTAVQSRDDGTRAYLDPYGRTNGKSGKTPTAAAPKPAVPAIGTLSCVVPPYTLASDWEFRANWSKVPGAKGYLVKLLPRNPLAFAMFKYFPATETSYVDDQRGAGTVFTSGLNPSGGEYDMTLYVWNGTAWNEVDKKMFTCADPTLGASQGWLDQIPGQYYTHVNGPGCSWRKQPYAVGALREKFDYWQICQPQFEGELSTYALRYSTSEPVWREIRCDCGTPKAYAPLSYYTCMDGTPRFDPAGTIKFPEDHGDCSHHGGFIGPVGELNLDGVVYPEGTHKNGKPFDPKDVGTNTTCADGTPRNTDAVRVGGTTGCEGHE